MPGINIIVYVKRKGCPETMAWVSAPAGAISLHKLAIMIRILSIVAIDVRVKGSTCLNLWIGLWPSHYG